MASCFYNHNELRFKKWLLQGGRGLYLGPVQVHHQNAKNMFANISSSGRKFTWLKKSDTGEDMAHCKLCNTNFSVAAGALYDVKQHAKRSTHVTAVEASSKTKSITNFVDYKKSSSVVLSETLFSNFVAEHNLPFSLADHFTKLLPKLCK